MGLDLGAFAQAVETRSPGSRNLAGKAATPLLDGGIMSLIAARPAEKARFAPSEAMHPIVTCSHAPDLETCHRIPGHPKARIARTICPTGQPEKGKAPESVAVGVAAQLLKEKVRDPAVPTCAKEHAR